MKFLKTNNMNKEFVTYEQALALKELGFDEPCFKQANPNGHIMWRFLCADEEQDYCLSIESITKSPMYELMIGVPTYSQAFRWFREKNNLWCCIQKYPTSDNPKRCYYELKGDNINTDKDESPNSYMSGWFDSYEDAELACLDKLIEICKNK